MPSDSPVLNCFQPDVLTAGDTMLVISSRFNCLSTVPVPSVVTDFWLYRKFLKSSEIVYNRLEIKNDIAKERRGLRHDVVYEVFCFGLG